MHCEDLLVHMHADMMPRCQIFSCTCTSGWCHAFRSSPGSGLWLGWGRCESWKVVDDDAHGGDDDHDADSDDDDDAADDDDDDYDDDGDGHDHGHDCDDDDDDDDNEDDDDDDDENDDSDDNDDNDENDDGFGLTRENM